MEILDDCSYKALPSNSCLNLPRFRSLNAQERQGSVMYYIQQHQASNTYVHSNFYLPTPDSGVMRYRKLSGYCNISPRGYISTWNK